MGRPGRVSVLVAGVGGQGLITLASTLAEAAVEKGVNALVAETHGLSQRGGSVEVHVRIGDVRAPLIPPGGADVLLGLEMIEAARRVEYLASGGLLLTADIVLRPGLPNVKVPGRRELEEELSRADAKLVVVPARELASKLGSTLYANTLMLGALAASGALDGILEYGDLERVVSRMKRARENLEALRMGYEYCKLHC